MCKFGDQVKKKKKTAKDKPPLYADSDVTKSLF